jgi:hypothetical protein
MEESPLLYPTEVTVDNKTVSLVLMGGLGNLMFQMSALLSYCKDKDLKPLLGYWTTHQSESSRWNQPFERYGINSHFMPWGGHKMKDPNITLGEIYPKLPWFNSKPNAFDWWFDQDLAWDIDTGKGGVFTDLDERVTPPYLMQGYFFNRKFWHHNRDYLLDIFQPHQKLMDWINFHYSNLFNQNTISVHIRFGAERDFMAPNQVPHDWIMNRIRENYDDTNILMFSDDIVKLRKFIESQGLRKSQCYVIDEDPHVCMILMSMCDKHILTNSTLSFWGAYLDKKQENPYTFIHESFFENHPKEMIPYNQWQISK